ncbi:MAG: endonuclease MutS2 [Acidobacteriota bacterium]
MTAAPAGPGDPLSRGDLEFDDVLALLAERTSTPMGRASALALEPSCERETVERRLACLSEAMAMGEDGFRWTFPALDDPSADLNRLRLPGAALGEESLGNLARIAKAGRRLVLSLGSRREQAPVMCVRIDGAPDLQPFIQAAARTFAADGSVRDGASRELAGIRSRLSALRRQLNRKLESYLDRPDADRYLGDRFVTQRSGRFVIPVRADRRHSVSGIVHAASGSGATLFMEPAETVSLNNELVALQGDESREIRRILRALTDQARRQMEDLSWAVETIAVFDRLAAAVALGRDLGAVPARLASERTVRLSDAKHPLLVERLRREGRTAVPISIHLRPQAPVLVISGPNTGGKTVVLKTVGLVALMNQAGLAVPAREALLPVFKQILADIGDHQSIAEDLSTFSSHMRALVRMTRKLEAPALVLIDELGTGTDPEEGMALGVAVVEFFRKRQSSILVTTHHNGLKAFAETTEGVRNAAVEFDETSLAPTYRLLDGMAGRSSGLEIAGRLGLSTEIVNEARALVGDGSRGVERYLARLAELAEAAVSDREAAREELVKVRAERERAERDRQRGAALARRRLESILEEAGKSFRRTAEEILGQLERTVGRERARLETARARAEFSRQARRQINQAVPLDPEPEVGSESTLPLQVGQRVLVPAIGREATVERVVSSGTLIVQVEGKRLQVDRKKVTGLRGPAPGPRHLPGVTLCASAGTSVSGEINLIGERVDVALQSLDRFLDRALLAGRKEVRVVHGHGTGRLRKAIRQHLQGHPLVAGHRGGAPNEGGEGATVLTLEA